MIATADIKPKIMRLWGNPSQTELSPQALRDAIERTWNIITMEMSMISPSFLAKFSDTFTLSESSDGWYGAANINDLAVPVGLEMRAGGAYSGEAGWSQIDTGSFDNWDYYKNIGQSAAIVTGGVGGIQIRTNFNSLNSEFRLRYISDGQSFEANSSLPQAMELPSFFSPMFEYGAAAECKDSIVTDRELFRAEIPSKANGFESKFFMFLDRYKGWLRSNRSTKGLTRRTPSNVTRRSRPRYRNLGQPR